MQQGQEPHMREQVIEPTGGAHQAPMPERPIAAETVRQGETSGHVRWVLGLSLLLAIVLMALVFAFA